LLEEHIALKMQMNKITLALENTVTLYQITAKELSDVLHRLFAVNSITSESSFLTGGF